MVLYPPIENIVDPCAPGAWKLSSERAPTVNDTVRIENDTARVDVEYYACNLPSSLLARVVQNG
jgi:hypothetical protein